MEVLPILDGRLPAACDAFLAPPGSGDVFAGRAWLEATLRHAVPPGTTPVLGVAGGSVLLPLLQRGGGSLGSLTTPYSQDWRPLGGIAAMYEAGRDLGRGLRGGAPARFEAMDPDASAVAPLLAGIRGEGLRLLRFDHFGLWREDLPEGAGWEGYLAGRPPALRNTVTRKLARAAATFGFEMIAAPGPALEAGIAAFEAVRARSWKPVEPFPDFDAALMRGLAATGELRLGVLRDRADGGAVAAQYWVVSAGHALVPKLFHVEALRAASPGTVLTAMMIRHLIGTDGVRVIDFGRGDDAYKRLWAGTRRQRIGVLAVDPRHPAGLAALLRHAAGRLRQRILPQGARA